MRSGQPWFDDLIDYRMRCAIEEAIEPWVRLRAACHFLAAELDGVCAPRQVIVREADALGIPVQDVERARKTLGVETVARVTTGTPRGFTGAWWSLPVR